MPHWKHAIRKGTTLAVVTLLHLLIVVYLTMPPAPMPWGSRATMSDRTGALQLVFLTPPSVSADVVPSHAGSAATQGAPRASRAVTSTIRSVSRGLANQRPAGSLPMKDEGSHANVELPPVSVAVESPYENPILRASQGGSNAQGRPLVPGYADRALVKTIFVGEQPSPRQILKEDA